VLAQWTGMLVMRAWSSAGVSAAFMGHVL
jgi:hypothetical protein